MKHTMEQLWNSMEELRAEVRNGFDGVHKRQDITNGNVKLNTEYRLLNKQNIDRLIDDREDKIRRVTDLLWKIVSISIMGYLGLSQFL